ncbi:MAG: chemotaxis protein CheA [bacterium]|nr:chemotaxis protein CheA [bacterium]
MDRREEKYADAFREEATELLSDMEGVILSLEADPQDQELINRLFRIMHTIKGSGAMFGFQEVADFAHHLETMLDMVRAGKRPLTPELISLLLQSKDLIQVMLSSGESKPQEISEQKEAILTRLKNLDNDPTANNPTTPSATCSINPPSPEKLESPIKQQEIGDAPRPSSKQQQKALTTWRLRIRLNPKVMLSGLDPLCLLRELDSMGECVICAQTDQVPQLDDMNPEECYFYWDVIINTKAKKEELEAVFLFVEDESQISITQLADESGWEVEPKRLGEILVERGDVTKEQVQEVLAKQKRSGELMVEAGLVPQSKIDSALAEQKMIQQLRGSQQGAETIRVSTKKLDRLINLVGEMVITQAQLSQTANRYQDADLLTPVENIERLTNELRDCALNIRMFPIESTFSKFRRLVHDLSAALGKEAELITEGGETELDKTVIERIHDPLIHLIRNSLDHGLEPPEDRLKAGKPACGTIRLSASQSGGEVIITIEDDGAGLNREKIRAKAIEQGLISESDNLTDSQIFNLIFLPGFSTASKVTDVSGRGVGMDVVKREISKLRGSVNIESQPGKGTKTSIHLPLTLAIIEGLLVAVGSSHYVIPLTFVQECVELSSQEVERSHGRHIINLRGEIIPYIRLREIFGISRGDEKMPAIEYVVVAMVEDKRIGLVTDSIIGDHQAVIKSLGKLYEHTEGISGATILGDGTIALIVDVRRLIECAYRQERESLVGGV